MELNEIKKVLYKNKPIAIKLYNEDNKCIYACETPFGRVLFCIPISESSEFKSEEPAQLLIRWIVK